MKQLKRSSIEENCKIVRDDFVNIDRHEKTSHQLTKMEAKRKNKLENGPFLTPNEKNTLIDNWKKSN